MHDDLVTVSSTSLAPVAVSHLEWVLRAGIFAVTAEITPPDSADPMAVYDEAALLAPACDALNATDGPGAHCHMSSVAMCALLTRAGHSVVMQIACRDRNRIAIQGDVLGAAALGVRNILCLTGDDVSVGDQPQAKAVFDLDSVQLLRTVAGMRDEGVFLSGRRLEVRPTLFLGAVCNPFAPPYDWRPLRLAKKVKAGAQFVQSQYCFDVSRLRQYMQRFCDLGLDRQVYYLVGVGPLRSARAAEYMRTQVPGVVIPDTLVERLRRTPEGRQAQEGQRICLEIIEQVREIRGVAGIHLMAFRQQAQIPQLVAEAGLLPRPSSDSLGPKPQFTQST